MTKASEQTLQQIERFLKKIAQKFPSGEDLSIVTDIHVRVSQESGEMVAFDDDDKEITRCVVEEWINNNDEDFYENIEQILVTAFASLSTIALEYSSHIALFLKTTTRNMWLKFTSLMTTLLLSVRTLWKVLTMI